jgi:hypothetical protein
MSAMKTDRKMSRFSLVLCGLGLLSLLTASTGCQVNMAGQTLPSPYWLTDDVQYFAPGPEFKLQKEAAQLKAYNAEQAAMGF